LAPSLLPKNVGSVTALDDDNSLQIPARIVNV
jgi:hypothetical protein